MLLGVLLSAKHIHIKYSTLPVISAILLLLQEWFTVPALSLYFLSEYRFLGLDQYDLHSSTNLQSFPVDLQQSLHQEKRMISTQPRE